MKETFIRKKGKKSEMNKVKRKTIFKLNSSHKITGGIKEWEYYRKKYSWFPN